MATHSVFTHVYFSQIVRPHCALIVVDVQNDFISGSLAIDEVHFRKDISKTNNRSMLNLGLFFRVTKWLSLSTDLWTLFLLFSIGIPLLKRRYTGSH